MPEKTQTSLFGTAIKGVAIGGLAGYLAGSGIEDLARELSINIHIEHVKTLMSCSGALAFSVFNTLKWFNRDEHEGELVIKIPEERKEPKKAEIKSGELLKGIANAVGEITYGIENQGLARNIYARIANALIKNPLRDAEISYEWSREGFFANQFGVFDSFFYDKREIVPKETLDRFFETGRRLHIAAVKGLSNFAEVLSSKQPISIDSEGWPKEFRETLEQEIALAHDISLWATYLSKREGVVGDSVRSKLAALGITKPDYLTHDVALLGSNILQLYDSILQNLITS